MAQRRRSIGAGAAILATGLSSCCPRSPAGPRPTPELRSFDAASPRGVSPDPKTEPPLHGTNPHGQGSVAVVDISPTAQRPSGRSDRQSDSEDVVVGRARGEQRADGSYHGHITVAALFGNEILGGADTNAGESKHEAIAGGPAQRSLHKHRYLPQRGSLSDSDTTTERLVQQLQPRPRLAGRHPGRPRH